MLDAKHHSECSTRTYVLSRFSNSMTNNRTCYSSGGYCYNRIVREKRVMVSFLILQTGSDKPSSEPKCSTQRRPQPRPCATWRCGVCQSMFRQKKLVLTVATPSFLFPHL